MTTDTEELIERLSALIAQRTHEQGLSSQNHPMALAVSVAGENRVNRAIAELAPAILSALQQLARPQCTDLADDACDCIDAAHNHP